MGKQGSLEIAAWFDKQNEADWEDVLQTKSGCDIISLAHFLPHQVTITTPCSYASSNPHNHIYSSLFPWRQLQLYLVCMVSICAQQLNAQLHVLASTPVHCTKPLEGRNKLPRPFSHVHLYLSHILSLYQRKDNQ